jgi:hypothetical protein
MAGQDTRKEGEALDLEKAAQKAAEDLDSQGLLNTCLFTIHLKH